MGTVLTQILKKLLLVSIRKMKFKGRRIQKIVTIFFKY